MGKVCGKCKEEKDEEEFHNSSSSKDGKQNYCIDCKKQWHQEVASVGQHEKYLSDRMFQMKKRYNAIRQRATEDRWNSGAYGKPYMSFEAFWQFYTETKETFEAMFLAYMESGYDRTLSPSLDRKDSTIGYEIGNLQWLTSAENSAKGNRD